MKPEWTNGCPSELQLDAYELGELGKEESQHIDDCGDCQSRLTERHEAFAQITNKDEIVRQLHVRLADTETAPPKRAWWQWAIPGLTAALATVLAVAFLVPKGTGDEGPSGVTRTKGSVSLSVFREHAGQVDRASRGQDFRPGDRLRFEVDLDRKAHVMIVGVEASGGTYCAYPNPGATGGSTPSGMLDAGANQLLPGAVELDESRGRESLHLVVCNRKFTFGELSTGASQVSGPPGCRTASFGFNKVDK